MVRMLAESPVAASFIANLGEVLQEMTERIRLEALEAGADAELTALLSMLENRARQHPAAAGARRPLVPLVLRPPGQELRFLSAITHFGTSEDVAVRDLRLELLFPADDVTRAAMAEAARTAPP